MEVYYMKKALALIISLLICTLCACTPGGSPPGTMATEQTQPPTESTAVSTTAAPATEAATEEQTTQPSETEGTHPQKINEAASAPTRQTESTEPLPTQPAKEETKQTETQPPVTEPPTTEAATEETQPATDPTEETEERQPETTPEPFEPDYAFKRQVASYAAQYINQYRSSPCTVLSGMSQVAQYRAGQLCYNFSHSTADKRAALAYYEYGRWIDATLAGLDESDSYYESDTSEAICRGFKGADAEALGRSLAEAIHSSGSHWAYVGSSEFSYMGIGVEYHDGKWYACVMVGTVNYG